MKENNFNLKKDVLKLKKFIEKTYLIKLDDKAVKDIWENYSENYYAAGWLSLPDDLTILKNDKNFQEVLNSKIPTVCLLLFENKNGINILKKSGKINIKDIKIDEIEIILKYVPEIEKSYYEEILKKKLFNNNFFIKFSKNNKYYTLYIINEENIEQISNLKKFLQD